jgi:hypothetical protein
MRPETVVIPRQTVCCPGTHSNIAVFLAAAVTPLSLTGVFDDEFRQAVLGWCVTVDTATAAAARCFATCTIWTCSSTSTGRQVRAVPAGTPKYPKLA